MPLLALPVAPRQLLVSKSSPQPLEPAPRPPPLALRLLVETSRTSTAIIMTRMMFPTKPAATALVVPKAVVPVAVVPTITVDVLATTSAATPEGCPSWQPPACARKHHLLYVNMT